MKNKLELREVAGEKKNRESFISNLVRPDAYAGTQIAALSWLITPTRPTQPRMCTCSVKMH